MPRDWPTCVDCGEEMPWLASSKLRDIYLCEKDGKLVIREREGDGMRWFAGIYTPKELMARFPQLFPDEISAERR